MKLPSRYRGARKHMLGWTKFYFTPSSTLSAVWTMNMKICLLKIQHSWANEKISFYFSWILYPISNILSLITKGKAELENCDPIHFTHIQTATTWTLWSLLSSCSTPFNKSTHIFSVCAGLVKITAKEARSSVKVLPTHRGRRVHSYNS